MTISGYRFLLTCPDDGHPLEHLADGVTNGVRTRAIAHCEFCGADVLIEVAVVVANRVRKRSAVQRASLVQARAARTLEAV